MHTLEIINLNAKINDNEILKDFSLTINSGEIHAIMGPNGVGKSTLSKIIMGNDNYKVIKGKILFDKKDITKLTTDERAKLGIFLGMQMPLEIEGVTNADFLRTASHSQKGNDFKLFDFIKEIEGNVISSLSPISEKSPLATSELFFNNCHLKSPVLSS